MAVPTVKSVKLTVGLEMLGEVPTMSEYSSAVTMLTKVLANIAATPDEPKYRRLRLGNAKISGLLATRGIRAILTGVGFVEEDGHLVLPAEQPLDALCECMALVEAQEAARSQQEHSANARQQQLRTEQSSKENEDRKRLKAQIADDAESRKEPGWKAKAAGVKDGRAITGCGDIGIGCNSGG